MRPKNIDMGRAGSALLTAPRMRVVRHSPCREGGGGVNRAFIHVAGIYTNLGYRNLNHVTKV